jgi:choline kinase
MNLVEITKKKLLEQCVDDVKPASGWKVMVVDEASMKIISAVCKMYDIIEKGVTGKKIDETRETIKFFFFFFFFFFLTFLLFFK